MTKKMILSLVFYGGGQLEKELFYKGSSEEEIAKIIMDDENELFKYMITHDDKGVKAFCFCGFMVEKEKIMAAQLSEPPFWEG